MLCLCSSRKHHQTPGQVSRPLSDLVETALATLSTVPFVPSNLKEYVKVCSSTSNDIHLLEGELQKKIAAKKCLLKLPAVHDTWVRNLCQEGIEPNPGPCTQTCTIWSYNIQSWYLHGYDLLSRAAKAKVDVVCLQEHGIKKEGIPGASRSTLQAGWHMTAVPKPQSHNSGWPLGGGGPGLGETGFNKTW